MQQNNSNLNVFLSGSISIDFLPDEFKRLLDAIVEHNFNVIIGDAFGADLIIQKYLLSQGYKNVSVYFSSDKIRNNAGKWNSVRIENPENKTGREMYFFKDIAMAEDADIAFMLWDGKSLGTAKNIERITALGKPFEVLHTNVLQTNSFFETRFKILLSI